MAQDIDVIEALADAQDTMHDLGRENNRLQHTLDQLLEIWASFEAGVLKEDAFFEEMTDLIAEIKRTHPDYQIES